MDRSSMIRVETTHDKEKRLAFKDKLAIRIADQETAPEPALVDGNPLEGTTVWHPDFGVCTVLTVDEKINNLTMTTPQNGRVDLIFSQVKSKLIPVDEAPEHVVKEFYRPTMAKNNTFLDLGSKALSLQLPNEFKKWTTANQFAYLTRNQHLTTDEANDVFAYLTGKELRVVAAVTVSWEDPTGYVESPKQEPVIAVPPEIDRSMVGQTVWHLDLGLCTVVSQDSKFIVLDFPDKGQLEMVLSYTQPRLSLSPTEMIDWASTYVALPEKALDVKEDGIKSLQVVLPPAFKTWHAYKQYSYLHTEKQLTPEEANDVLSILSGVTPVSKTLFQIEWDENADLAKIEAANRHLAELAAAPVQKEPVLLPPIPGATRSAEEVEVVEKTAVTRLSVPLPDVFGSWSPRDQYIFLTSNSRLSPDEAQDVLAICQGKQPVSNNLFEITGNHGLLDTDFVVRRVVEEIDVVRKEVAALKLSVSLPPTFNVWSVSDQYLFLSRTKHLTADESNDLIDILHRKTPHQTNVLFEITWDGEPNNHSGAT